MSKHILLSLSLCALLSACQPEEPGSSSSSNATPGETPGESSCLFMKEKGVLVCGDEEIALTPSPSPGPPGRDGQDGTDGEDGQDGQDGADGANGLDGEDGTGVTVRRLPLPVGDETCPEGGERIELYEGEIDGEPEASFEVCDVQCSQGEWYEPEYKQCIKMVEIKFTGSLYRMTGDLPESFKPSLLDPDPVLGIDGTPCSGVLRYPFRDVPFYLDDFYAEYRFGAYQHAGLELTLGDRTYRKELTGALEDLDASMYREVYPLPPQAQLNVEVVQRGLEGVPSGWSASLRLLAGHDALPYDEAEDHLLAPDTVKGWQMLSDGAIETITVEAFEQQTEAHAQLVCRIVFFE